MLLGQTDIALRVSFSWRGIRAPGIIATGIVGVVVHSVCSALTLLVIAAYSRLILRDG